MRLIVAVFLLSSVLVGLGGCGQKRRQSPMERQLESLRQSGYGFDNPNVEAARQRARR